MGGMIFEKVARSSGFPCVPSVFSVAKIFRLDKPRTSFEKP
jgi:hypothetical protein